jgi:hypothetical protein
VTWVILLLALMAFSAISMPAHRAAAARHPDAAAETLVQAGQEQRHQSEARLPSQHWLGRPGVASGKAPSSMTLHAQSSRAAWRPAGSTALHSPIQRKAEALHARTLSAVHRRRAHMRA